MPIRSCLGASSRRRPLLLTATALGLAALTACGTPGGDAAPAPSATPSSTAAPPSNPSGLTVSEAWVTAVPKLGERPMTAVHATVTNTGPAPVQIVSARTSASGRAELHETAGGSMRPVPSFTVDPGETLRLAPGGDHIMIVGMTKPLPVGDDVTVDLTTKDGDTLSVEAVARPFSGADESYADPSGSPSR